jgi:hypothetical protein
MNRRILIATVAALSVTGMSMAGVTAASAEYDSAGVGTIMPERYGYPSSPGYQDQSGYHAYGSGDSRGAPATYGTYLGSGAYAQSGYRVQPEPRGNLCMDEDGNRFACR